jgi:hypothetical protein
VSLAKRRVKAAAGVVFGASWCSLLAIGMVAGTLFVRAGSLLGRVEDWCERKLE